MNLRFRGRGLISGLKCTRPLPPTILSLKPTTAGSFLRDLRVSVCPGGQLPLLLPSRKDGISSERHLPSYSSQNYALPSLVFKLAREKRAFLSKLAQNMIS